METNNTLRSLLPSLTSHDRYNDISPLENHHCSIAFRLLELPECNLLENFTKDMYKWVDDPCALLMAPTNIKIDFNSSTFSFHYLLSFREIREGIIRCILATDMARHNDILTQFSEIISIFDYKNNSHKNLVSTRDNAIARQQHRQRYDGESQRVSGIRLFSETWHDVKASHRSNSNKYTALGWSLFVYTESKKEGFWFLIS